ncbi:MAG TPA: GNAT family N-acetyltransferase [Candidatus Tumulicola sp.]|jgi:ribosomal-protein-alanine N-acetyltransferase
MRIIRSDRLLLVPVTPQNARVLWSVLQQPNLREYQDLPDVDAAAFESTVAQRPRVLEPAATGRFEWLVHFRLRECGNVAEPLGWVSLRISDRTPAVAEIGYSIVRAHRGRGIASEAVAALVEEGFDRGRLRCVRAYCVPENASSRRVLGRNGFEDDGVLPHGATVRGRPVDVIAYSLERQRWESLRTSPNSSAI